MIIIIYYSVTEKKSLVMRVRNDAGVRGLRIFCDFFHQSVNYAVMLHCLAS